MHLFQNAKVQINTAAEQLIAGLLSAYFLTHDDVFVRRAAELADLYLPSFNTSTGLPFRMLNLRTRVSLVMAIGFNLNSKNAPRLIIILAFYYTITT